MPARQTSHHPVHRGGFAHYINTLIGSLTRYRSMVEKVARGTVVVLAAVCKKPVDMNQMVYYSSSPVCNRVQLCHAVRSVSGAPQTQCDRDMHVSICRPAVITIPLIVSQIDVENCPLWVDELWVGDCSPP